MPKLSNRPPKYCKDGKYAAVYIRGKRIRLGLYGSPDSQTAYARLVAESKASPHTFPIPKGVLDISVKVLAAAFLDHAKETLDHTNYGHYRILVFDFLLKLYGDDIRNL